MYGLKADLNRLIELETEELKAREQEVATGKEDLATMRNRTKTNRLWFAGHKGPEWLRRAIAEKERADKAETLNQELVESLKRSVYELDVAIRFMINLRIVKLKEAEELLDFIRYTKVRLAELDGVLGDEKA